MSTANVPPPPDVPCSGCDAPTPYEAGPQDSDAPTYGEWLRTPIGLTFARSHRNRECVIASRARLQGTPTRAPRTKADRMRDSAVREQETAGATDR